MIGAGEGADDAAEVSDTGGARARTGAGQLELAHWHERMGGASVGLHCAVCVEMKACGWGP